MASPRPHYTQPGPSSLSYHAPPHFTFGGNHQPPHQYPNPPPPGIVNSGGYPHQGPHRPGPAYYYPPPPPYQPGFYPSLEHQRPLYPPHHTNGAPVHTLRPPSSPNRPAQFTHTSDARQSAGPHPSHQHVQQYAHVPPGHSPSAFPRQVLRPPPRSPLQHPLPLKPDFHAQPDHPPPLVPSQEPHQFSPPPPSSTTDKSSSPTVKPASPAHSHSSSSHWTVHPSTESSSLAPLPASPLLNPQLEPPVPYKAFPERSNSICALKYRRPDVLAAAAVTVASAARPPHSFYDLTAPLNNESLETSAKEHSVSPEPAHAPVVLTLFPTPDSPKQQSLASTATTTTPTSPRTPILGSPLSSITSLSPATKSPSDKVLASPAPSVATIATEAPETAQKPVPTPLKKSWASLLRPASTDAPNATTSKGPNSLPTSSVQGFSVPATPLTSAKAPAQPAALVALLTAPHLPVGPVPPMRARGLVNLGNMCFANTVLQVLLFCPPFYRLFVELERTPRGDISRATPLIDATVEFMKEFQAPMTMQEKEDTWRDAFVPTCIYDALKEKKRFDSMRGGQQEDAEEFLGFYLDTLEEELLSIAGVPPPSSVAPPAIPAAEEERVEKDTQANGWLEVGKRNKSVITRTHKSLESPISRMFGGRFRTALKVPGARESVIVDPWSRLQLDIQPDYVHTIEDALCHGAAPGTVQVARPGAQCDASQQTLIDALPPILVLHLKRFLYDTTVGDVVKLRKRIAFGTELEMPKEALAPARRARHHRYQLFGVLNHHGSSATGGHYTLDVLHPNAREGWLRIDDELVQHVREEDLHARDVGDDRTAYLLFYQRIVAPGART